VRTPICGVPTYPHVTFELYGKQYIQVGILSPPVKASKKKMLSAFGCIQYLQANVYGASHMTPFAYISSLK
jgi:hypothetical protein